jgi:hypothetical protein
MERKCDYYSWASVFCQKLNRRSVELLGKVADWQHTPNGFVAEKPSDTAIIVEFWEVRRARAGAIDNIPNNLRERESEAREWQVGKSRTGL